MFYREITKIISKLFSLSVLLCVYLMPSLEFVFLSRWLSWTRCGSRLYRFLIIAFSIYFGSELSLTEQDSLEDDSPDADAMAPQFAH